MSDELETVTGVAIHAAGPAGAGTLGAWLMHFFKGRAEAAREEKRVEAEKQLAVTLSQIQGTLAQLVVDVREHKAVFETVVLTRQAVEALGGKLDDLRARVGALEQRRKR